MCTLALIGNVLVFNPTSGKRVIGVVAWTNESANYAAQLHFDVCVCVRAIDERMT